MPVATNSKRERKHWTYIDAMATAVASVPGTRLSANSEKWHAAWERALRSNAARELLPEVHFESREPYQAMSDQVEALLRTLSRAGILSLGNPRYLVYSIDPKAKESILKENEDLLDKHAQAIKAIAKTLEEDLGEP